MNEINNNPYRILGICSNANDKTIQKQTASFCRYIEVDKIISSDVDFLMLLGRLERNKEQIDESNRKLERVEDKIFYSLFWFIQITETDKEAISIMDTDFQKAKSIWEKSIEDSYTNYSAVTNLSNLYLIETFHPKEINKNSLEKAIALKRYLFVSEYFETYKNRIINENEKIDIIGLFKRFFDVIYDNLDLSDTHFCHELIYTYFEGYPFEMKEYVKQKVIKKEITQIEKILLNFRESNNDITQKILVVGENLYNDTFDILKKIKKILREDEIEIQNISDKLSEEILQYGIDYWYQELHKENTLECQKAMKLVQKTQSISLSGRVCDRIEKELKDMQEDLPFIGSRSEGNVSLFNFVIIGVQQYGSTEELEDGSYVATVWFVIIFIPLIPICSRRIYDYDRYIEVKLHKGQVLRTYIFVFAIIALLYFYYLLVQTR